MEFEFLSNISWGIKTERYANDYLELYSEMKNHIFMLFLAQFE
jgi:hypothetical protein